MDANESNSKILDRIIKWTDDLIALERNGDSVSGDVAKAFSDGVDLVSDLLSKVVELSKEVDYLTETLRNERLNGYDD